MMQCIEDAKQLDAILSFFSRSCGDHNSRYGESSLDRLRSDVVTLSYTQSNPLEDNNSERRNLDLSVLRGMGD